MELYQTAITGGVGLKFSEDSVVAINAPFDRKGGMLSPGVMLCTYPVVVDGWCEFDKVAGETVVLTGPGEYEKSGMYIQGVGSAVVLQGKEMQTTSWFVDADGVRVLVLGDVHDKSIVQKSISEFGNVDVLIPFCRANSDGGQLNAVEIVAVAAELQVQRIVPIGDAMVLKKKIAKELGDSEELIGGKYVLKKRELLEGTAKVVLFV